MPDVATLALRNYIWLISQDKTRITSTDKTTK